MIAVYAFANTELHQLLKLPMLMQHFVEHKEETPGITLAEFLYQHYILPQPKDADYDSDMKLPFKTDVCSVFHAVALVREAPVLFLQPAPVIYGEQRYAIYKAPFFISTAISDIWQPPRAC
jgi:hypothetical protein